MNTLADTPMSGPTTAPTNSQTNKERLIQEINAVAAETAALTKPARDLNGQKGDAQPDGLESDFHELQNRLHVLQGRIVEQGRLAARVADEYVHAHPWQSVGATAAASVVAGVIIGAWMRRP